MKKAPLRLAEQTVSEGAGQFERLWERLNIEQRRAVEAMEGPVMVLAGPGTGKTQVLAMRIAHILRQTQMDPGNILCLTFTESGVAAMRARLQSIMGRAGYYVHVHTFHSFCNELIQDHPELFARGSDWQALNDIERVEILQAALDSLPGTSALKPGGDPYLYINDLSSNIKALKQEYIAPQDLKRAVQTIERFTAAAGEALEAFTSLPAPKRTLADCEAVAEVMDRTAKKSQLPEALRLVMERFKASFLERLKMAEGPRDEGKARTAYKDDLKVWFERLKRQSPKQKEIVQVYAAYEQALKKQGRYDYEDMILLTLNELKRNNDLLAEYQEKFQYILVDEYQDTNGAQNELVRLLGSFDDQPNIFVVGDDKQSIYRFQGASLSNMLEFFLTHEPHVQVVTLKENYRSQSAVLKAAAAVIAHNRESISRYLKGVTQELSAAAVRIEQPVELVELPSEAAEDYFIVQRIKQLLKGGVPAQEIAVLCRNHRDGEQLIAFMRKLNVPARKEAGEDALRDTRVRQWIKLIQYLGDEQREDLLAEIVQFDWWGLNTLDVYKVIHRAGRTREPLWNVLNNPAELKAAGVKSPETIELLVQKLAVWQQRGVNAPLSQWLSEILWQSGWLNPAGAAVERLLQWPKMSRLLNEARQLELSQPGARPVDFSRHLDLYYRHKLQLKTESWQGAGEEAVRVMTAHKAKGLEFEHVFIPRFNNRHWGRVSERTRVPLPHGLVRFDYVAAEQNDEDERRLFYVALTRAKQGVILTRSAKSATDRPTEPSVFAGEIDPAVLQSAALEPLPEAENLKLKLAELMPLPPADEANVREWVKEKIQGYVLSATHLNDYLACPRRFFFRDLLRVPGLRTPAQATGSAIHAALQQYGQQAEKKQGALGLKKLLNLFTERLKQEPLTAVQQRDARQRGRRLLSDYWEQKEESIIRPALLEYDFASHHVMVSAEHLGSDSVPITGKIDRIALDDGERRQPAEKWAKGAAVIVTDYKTSNPDFKWEALKPGGEYRRQLVFYALLCELSERFPYRMAAGEIEFVRKSSRTGKLVMKRFIIEPEEMNELKETVRRVWREIGELKFLSGSNAPGCGQCEYCAAFLPGQRV